MIVRNIYEILNSLAPFDSQEEWDNSGLLIGSDDDPVTGILFALDVTDRVIDEAVSRGASLIVTHHPLMFSPVQRLVSGVGESDLIIRMIRNHVSLIAAHTCLDIASGGINDVLAAYCGIPDASGNGFFRFGTLPDTLSAGIYADILSESLSATVRLMGPKDTIVRKVCVCSGGGGEYWTEALKNGCDAFVTGEIRHHHALAAAGSGIVVLECGHYATEAPGIRALAEALQNAFNTVECNVGIFVSEIPAYSFPQQT